MWACVCVCFLYANVPYVQRSELGLATGLSAAVFWLRPLKPGLRQSPLSEAECARLDPCPHMLSAPPVTTNTVFQNASKHLSFLGGNEHTHKPKPNAQ